MAEASIPVDLFNPGQVFACMGFLEAAEVLCGNAEGGFDWRNPTDVRFSIRAKGERNPIKIVLQFLEKAEVHSIAPTNSNLSTSKWDVPTRKLQHSTAFPFPVPSSPATLPAVLEVSSFDQEGQAAQLLIRHWGEDRRRTSLDNVKFWAGSGGYPGAALAQDALNLIRDRCGEAVSDPFALSEPQSSSFRFDWRRDYIDIHIGFSLNNHANDRFTPMGFPIVEIMAAIGLTNARPEALSKLEYRYGVLSVLDDGDLLDICLLRSALGGVELPFSRRTFRMYLDWPGREGQARCITNVTEETI